MTTDGRDSPAADPPSVDALSTLDADRWAAALPHVRAALRDLDTGQDGGALDRLRGAPATRLVGGRLRLELCRELASGGPLWRALVERVADLDPRPAALDWVVDRPSAPATTGDAADREQPAGQVDARIRRDLERARGRLRQAREERDGWRRRAEGAEARAQAADRSLAGTRADLDALREEVAQLRARLEAAAQDQDRAVARERRRQASEVGRLRDEIAELRRAEEERRRAQRRRRAAEEQALRAAREAEDEARRARSEARRTRVVPARPTQLPDGVANDTTEAARLLLHPGRLVLVDGYNVTLQHRGHLDLEVQRAWLVRLIGALVTQRRIRPIVMFDGDTAGGARPAVAREVQVRFTTAGVTADDEVVLAVEGTDEPVVVVTDDQELRARVRLAGADVIGTRALLGVAG